MKATRLSPETNFFIRILFLTSFVLLFGSHVFFYLGTAAEWALGWISVDQVFPWAMLILVLMLVIVTVAWNCRFNRKHRGGDASEKRL